MQLGSIPLDDGYQMPAEYEPHSGCWMLWPERTDAWRLGAKPAQQATAEIAAAIARFEPVTVGVSSRQYLNARSRLSDGVRIIEISSNDSWMRDVGPTFIINRLGGLRGVAWEFNAWGGQHGGLYYPWDQDALVARKVLEIERCDWYRPGIILEGGSIHVDGEGTLITTEECLLNPNRNPDLDKGEIERVLMTYLNLEKVIWLPRGVYNDETSGHIDNLCCFIRPGVVVLSWTEDRSDPQYPISLEAFDLLSQERDAHGRRLEIIKIHQPNPMEITPEESHGIDYVEGTKLRQPGDRLPGSYINFYIANGGVIVPIFNDPWDSPALNILQNLFPDRSVVGVHSREILLGGGNIHCITLQQPRG